MKKYFLHDGTESSGPFDLEELKAKKITRTTPVWFEGMEHWKNAEEIPELSSIFVAIPPPFKSFSAIPPKSKVEQKKRKQKKSRITERGEKNCRELKIFSFHIPKRVANVYALEDASWRRR